MIEITIPTNDVNSETCVVSQWHVANRQQVRAGEVIAEVETSKTVFDVVVPQPGYLLHAAEQGQTLPMGATIALLFDTAEALTAFSSRQNERQPESPALTRTTVRATKDAERTAAMLGVDLALIGKPGLITRKDVEEFLQDREGCADRQLPAPLSGPAGAERILIVGSGRGAQQVLEILRAMNDDASKSGGVIKFPVAIIDDYEVNWGKEVEGVPVVGGAGKLAALHTTGAVDSAVIAISTSVSARSRFRHVCEGAGLPLTNAIDPSCRIPPSVQIGTGNVISAFCHFGTAATIGDNNFISAYNSYDHHCGLGDDISTGPGCMASGSVTIGSRVRMGTGVFIEPGIQLGEDVQIASGAIIIQSVPRRHVVRTKLQQTISPID